MLSQVAHSSTMGKAVSTHFPLLSHIINDTDFPHILSSGETIAKMGRWCSNQMTWASVLGSIMEKGLCAAMEIP